MFDDLARHGSAVRRQRGNEPEQLKRDARRALCRHPLPPLSGFTGSLGSVGGGVARHVTESGMPEQVVPVGMGRNPATTGMPSRSRSSASWSSSEPSMPGSTSISPPSTRTAMELVQTHALCRTQTPSATSVSIGSPRVLDLRAVLRHWRGPPGCCRQVRLLRPGGLAKLIATRQAVFIQRRNSTVGRRVWRTVAAIAEDHAPLSPRRSSVGSCCSPDWRSQSRSASALVRC